MAKKAWYGEERSEPFPTVLVPARRFAFNSARIDEQTQPALPPCPEESSRPTDERASANRAPWTVFLGLRFCYGMPGKAGS